MFYDKWGHFYHVQAFSGIGKTYYAIAIMTSDGKEARAKFGREWATQEEAEEELRIRAAGRGLKPASGMQIGLF